MHVHPRQSTTIMIIVLFVLIAIRPTFVADRCSWKRKLFGNDCTARWRNGVTEKPNKNKCRERYQREKEKENGSSIDAQFGKAGFRRRRQWLCLRSFRTINAFWVIEFTRNCRTRHVQTHIHAIWQKRKKKLWISFLFFLNSSSNVTISQVSLAIEFTIILRYNLTKLCNYRVI